MDNVVPLFGDPRWSELEEERRLEARRLEEAGAIAVVQIPADVRPNVSRLTRTGFAEAELILDDGLRVRIQDRGVFEEGRVEWIRIYGSPSPHYARRVAERFGRVTEADEAEDGSRSFSIVAEPAS